MWGLPALRNAEGQHAGHVMMMQMTLHIFHTLIGLLESVTASL